MSQETQKENTSVNLKEEVIMNYESTGAIKGVVLTVAGRSLSFGIPAAARRQTGSPFW